MKSETILLVDDDESQISILEFILESDFKVQSVSSGEAAIDIIGNQKIDLIILDINMPPGMSGMAALKIIKDRWPETEVIMNTVIQDTEMIVESIKLGAFDYIIKGCEPEDISNKVENAFEKIRNRKKIQYLSQQAEPGLVGDMLLGPSTASRFLFKQLKLAAGCSANCLLIGETGTGKDVAAKYIHYNGDRANNPYIPVNLPAIPPNLIESTLFGHERGAFTGAVSSQPGKFELADGGTILLDEIGDLSLECQVKLLRVLEQGEIWRVGSPRKINVDVRIIAATTRDPEDMMISGKFRDDLFYRLNVLPIRVPPLRNREKDITMLALHFLEQLVMKYKKSINGISTSVLGLLKNHTWRGNIRELHHLMERMVIYCEEEVIGIDSVPLEYFTPKEGSSSSIIMDRRDDYEKAMIIEALVANGNNRSRAARQLGVPLGTLRYRIKKLGIQSDSDKFLNVEGS